MSTVAITEIEFLKKLQRLLAEGDFTATYKFALLNALADLSLERECAADGSLRLPTNAIAEKFIEYYWRQAHPYKSKDGAAIVLVQNAHAQTAVINELAKQQRQYATLAAARASVDWRALVNSVRITIVKYPLWLLQATGGERDEFLYLRADYDKHSIRLLPGVAHAFRALYALVLDAVRGAWVRQINRIAANRPLLADSDLSAFLFGSERGNLQEFARVLREHQSGRCLYCRREIPLRGARGRSADAVDHFIAWSRYPADLGHNLVLACNACNTSKSNFLAHPQHVERWYASHIERSAELSARLAQQNLPHDIERSRAITEWAYEQGEAARTQAWIGDKRFARLDWSWRSALGATSLARVAEPRPS